MTSILEQKIHVSNNTKDSEYVYLDCVLFNKSFTEAKNVIFDQTRLNSVIDDISKYKLGIKSITAKFFMPFFNLMDYDYVMEFKFAPDNLTATHIIPKINVKIYTAEQLLEYVNTGLLNCFDQIKTQYNAIYGALAWENNVLLPQFKPGIVYNPETQLFTFYADRRMDKIDNNRIDIYFNYSLYNLFAGLNFIEFNGEFTLLIFEAGFHNLNYVSIDNKPYIKSVQDTPSLGYWSDIANIAIGGIMVPARSEQLLISDYQEVSTGNIIPIFDTFPIGKTSVYERFIQFDKPTIAWIDLLSNGPLNRIQFNMNYIKYNGKIEPITLAPRESIFVKLVLAKTLFTS